ncbi:hypothetical protein [Azospirillum sp. SYSU D00513]|uniref:hypothetical protein n=1 Tax=Azospirillum sp. SYSU D00513 TaxID=2812561 RepID=UPI001A96A14B|nr:hypothetical protein [Azospirillum sp. SYSU D00513]
MDIGFMFVALLGALGMAGGMVAALLICFRLLKEAISWALNKEVRTYVDAHPTDVFVPLDMMHKMHFEPSSAEYQMMNPNSAVNSARTSTFSD